MGKWPLVGNKHIIDFLSRSISNNKISASYIFLGPDDLGKSTIANYFASSLLCSDKSSGACGKCKSCESLLKTKTHSDLYVLKREEGKKNILVEQTRDFINKLGLSSFLGEYKIGIIKNADSLNIESANALLKTLEEPKKDVVIILLAEKLEGLPKTIASRSQILNFYPVGQDCIYDYLSNEHKAPRSVAKNLSSMCLGRPALAMKFFEDKDFYNNYLEKVNGFLDFFNQDINARLIAVESLSNKIKAKDAINTIGIWQGVVRDLALLKLNNRNLAQHQIILDKLSDISTKLNFSSIVELNNLLEKTKIHINANVGVKNALGNVVINLV